MKKILMLISILSLIYVRSSNSTKNPIINGVNTINDRLNTVTYELKSVIQTQKDAILNIIPKGDVGNKDVKIPDTAFNSGKTEFNSISSPKVQTEFNSLSSSKGTDYHLFGKKVHIEPENY